jgi:undecaprenyl phosphate-alpha-L-ara4FN deformylase
VHCYDHVLWQDYVRERDHACTCGQMALAVDAFERVFGEHPTVHGAAGWQVNAHVPELETRFGFHYASDTRGTRPFLPVIEGRMYRCPARRTCVMPVPCPRTHFASTPSMAALVPSPTKELR